MQSPFLRDDMSGARFRRLEGVTIPAQENNKGTDCIALSMLLFKSVLQDLPLLALRSSSVKFVGWATAASR